VGGAIVTIAKTPLGRILLDSKGRALYDFPPDKGGMSTRYGACAARGSTLRDVRRQPPAADSLDRLARLLLPRQAPLSSPLGSVRG
jgi:hypothetical protein